MYKSMSNTNPSAKSVSNVVEQNFHEVEELTMELERLLVRLAKGPDSAGIRTNVSQLERWMGDYRQGRNSSHEELEAGMSLLDELQSRIKLAAEEMQRLEGEGGNPATKEQTERLEDLLKIVRHIGIVRSHLERRFELAVQEREETREAEDA